MLLVNGVDAKLIGDTAKKLPKETRRELMHAVQRNLGNRFANECASYLDDDAEGSKGRQHRSRERVDDEPDIGKPSSSVLDVAATAQSIDGIASSSREAIEAQTISPGVAMGMKPAPPLGCGTGERRRPRLSPTPSARTRS